MIDNFALGLSHALMLLAAWLLIFRPDLDKEDPPEPESRPDQGFGRKPADGGKKGRPGA